MPKSPVSSQKTLYDCLPCLPAFQGLHVSVPQCASVAMITRLAAQAKGRVQDIWQNQVIEEPEVFMAPRVAMMGTRDAQRFLSRSTPSMQGAEPHHADHWPDCAGEGRGAGHLAESIH